MSTGRRLAKRSIIGTKVCALSDADGLWYSGVIQNVKTVTMKNGTTNNDNCLRNLNESNDLVSETKYVVRFDFKTQASEMKDHDQHNNLLMNPAQTLRRNAMTKEFYATELIGPGFRSINGIELQSGQRVYITYNGRETSGDVITHNTINDEVLLKITAIGYEEPIVLKKRLEEVRLLESRRSARLAYQERNTDFARLADMAGGEKRRTSYSLEMKSSPPSSSSSSSSSSLSLSSSSGTTAAAVMMAAGKEATDFNLQRPSRKRPSSNDFEYFNYDGIADDEEMNECNAAMILVTLSLSPKSPKYAEKWLGSSPGSSSASWSSGSSSPPLSDDGHNVLGATNINDATLTARNRTTSVSTSDEGIVVDFKEEAPRRKRVNKTIFLCTYPGCKLSEYTKAKIERHIRLVHLGHKKPRRSFDQSDDDFVDSDSHEEEFYYTEIEDNDDDCKTPSPASPPTLSHRDMARPPHEDPEYQRQLVGNIKQNSITQQQSVVQKNCNKSARNNGNACSQQRQTQNNNNNNVSYMPTSPLACHNYTWTPNSGNSLATGSSVYVNNNAILKLHQQLNPPQQSSQTLIKHIQASPSQTLTSYPSPTYINQQQQQQQQQQHQNFRNNSVVTNGNLSTSKMQHYKDSNSNGNGMLHQLSQNNITVNARQEGNSSQQQHSPSKHQQLQQQLQQLTTVTITPSFTSSTGQIGNNSNDVNLQQQQHQQHQQQQQQQRQQQKPLQQHVITATSNVGINKAPTLTVASKVSTESVQQTQSTGTKHTPNSPNRRTRGENKKCRKVYGMDRRELWCTQCRWKKACSRFGD